VDPLDKFYTFCGKGCQSGIEILYNPAVFLL